MNLAVNGNATASDLNKLGLLLNNTARLDKESVAKLGGELLKFQTVEQTKYTFSIFKSLSRDDPDFKSYIVSSTSIATRAKHNFWLAYQFQADLFDKTNKTLLSLSEHDRSEKIAHNKLLRIIYRNEQKCPNTFVDIIRIGVENRNCIEPTLENYCSAIKRSPNVDGFDLFGSDADPEDKPNPLYLLFKYIRSASTSTVQRDLVSDFVDFVYHFEIYFDNHFSSTR